MFPSWIKSKNCKPLFVYFLAIEITSLKFASIISFFAILDSLSPFLILLTKILKSEIEIPIVLLSSINLFLRLENNFFSLVKKLSQDFSSLKKFTKFGFNSFPT